MFVLKMFRVLSAVLLLCVCGVCVRVSAERAGDFGVKLCGREFIRAVIFTCGGSRWRRSAQDPGRSGHRRGARTECRPVPRGATLERPRPDRRKRNFSMGLAGMCCNQGCTKNDIGLLC
uniref:Relaxin 1 n=1 Tax=Cyprinus carpio carpio TaxID=630221 RepID=A0A8C1CGE9_CYPCA